MKLVEQNILFFSRSTQHGGTENVILQLCEVFHSLVNKIIVVSATGFPIERLKPFRIQHYSIPDIENKSLRNIITVARKIKTIIEREDITVIHTHHRMAAFYVKLLGLHKLCVFINTSHNVFYNKRFLTRFAYKDANLVACGEMVKKNLEEVYGLKNVAVIHNAVKAFDENIIYDEELEKMREEGKFLVGNIGRLSMQKGMEYYILAIPTVVEKHPEAQFYIIGSGEDMEKLIMMSQGLPVTFMGYREDIQNLMSQMDLIVLSSLWEGLPLTPIEAFSVGKTVVATGVDGTLEVVANNQNGFLVEPRNDKQIAEKVCWMIEHPEERLVMEKAAKETFKKFFSFDKFTEAYVNFYERL